MKIFHANGRITLIDSCFPSRANFDKLYSTLKQESTAENLSSGTKKSTSTAQSYVIQKPTLGFLNLMGETGSKLLAKDRDALGSGFGNSGVCSEPIPRCNVLFIYCILEGSGKISGSSFSLRDVIKTAGAHIVVVASEIPANVVTSREFGQYISRNEDWSANIVITLNRNGDVFEQFFRKLFMHMYTGMSMPIAWSKLAPQGTNNQADSPGTIAILEAGHIAFSL
jgi:hypothetical protein